ncbi:glycosyltransferase [Kineococcus rhizosphaerae]|uniref:Glycosyltransferase involved in cell wall biosynthesis n=1 Tax=Kineococcus rhizosphaerae TaxID=559628 RepID=A0A2T0R4G1_9ACTN|nr:glycosyltransferase [Kineococcus rhizosphaerae]PRY15258.1 glycosyltransferase involved in cell wall biosynthesis [Kineococcus rhizosphaerae]
MRVFVLLEHGKGDPRWGERFRRGEVYEATPYGYGTVEDPDVQVVLSTDHAEGRLSSFVRRGTAKLLGFDLVHALRQLPELRRADVVWTHTEREHLGLGLLKGLGLGRGTRPLPPVIAQSVWVADHWNSWPRPRRALFRWCLGHVELLTTLAPLNAAFLERLTGSPVRVVPFGVREDPWPGSGGVNPGPTAETAAEPAADRPIRVLCLGNDVHRDWELLRELARVAGPAAEVTLITKRLAPSFAEGLPNLHVRPALQVAQTADAYAAADVVCLPLHTNLHASGITVLLECATWSTPCVVTDTGGLRTYFDDDAVRYLPEGAAAERWWQEVRDLVGPAGESVVAAMRARVRSEQFTDTGYAERHVALSRELLARMGTRSRTAETLSR